MRRLRRALYAVGAHGWTTLRYRAKVWRIQRRLVRTDVAVSRSNAKRFWRRHLGVGISTRWHFVYAQQSGRDDERYVPEDVFYWQIEPTLNVHDLFRAYADKNLYGRWLPEDVLPEAVLRCVHGRYYGRDFQRVDPASVLREGEQYVIKPSLLSGGGRQVELLTVEAGKPRVGHASFGWDQLQALYQGNLIVQKPLQQHPDIAAMNASSINTVRIMTLNLGKPTVLSSVIRVGRAGSLVDNMTSGGAVVCGIRQDGRLNSWATDYYDNRVFVHTDNGYRFDGQEVPGIHAARELVLGLHQRLFYFDLASWDVAIDPQCRPTLVEVNLRGQEISFHQVNNGPLFGERTEEVLHHVRSRSRG